MFFVCPKPIDAGTDLRSRQRLTCAGFTRQTGVVAAVTLFALVGFVLPGTFRPMAAQEPMIFQAPSRDDPDQGLPQIPKASGTLHTGVWLAPTAQQNLWADSDSAAEATVLYDRLNAPPAKWFLDQSDCDATVVKQSHLPAGGIDGNPCELIELNAGNGSEALLVYPLEPIMPLDTLSASVALRCAKPGARVGFRIRFPHVQDKSTHRSEAIIVYGATYDSDGQYQRIGVGAIERMMRVQSTAIRQRHGIRADLSDPFVDAVVINAYCGAGNIRLRIDELKVVGMIPMSYVRRPGEFPVAGPTDDRSEVVNATTTKLRRIYPGQSDRPSDAMDPSANSSTAPQRLTERDDADDRPAFQHGQLVKIIQHNGEPLRYLRTLGFDAVLLASPPTQALLREAMTERVSLYAPPPEAPDPDMELYLDPVAGWYLGSAIAVDAAATDAIDRQSRKLRRWPTAWQRPLIVSPLEQADRFSPMADAMVRDFPHASRGLRPSEEVAELVASLPAWGEDTQRIVGVPSMPVEELLVQVERIADGIGAPRPRAFRWPSMLRQVVHGLQLQPSAILFRSTRSLSSGTDLSAQRASALSYTNRLVAALTPWVVGVRPASPPTVEGDYSAARLVGDNFETWLLTSTATRGSETLAGDGAAVTIRLAPDDIAKTYWRVSHFSADRLTPQADGNGASLQIVSPDFVEIIVCSHDPGLGARLVASARRFVNQAAQDRWQLANQSVRQAIDDQQLVRSLQSATRPAGDELASLAQRTLQNSESLLRGGDFHNWFRQVRRVDAWVARSQWQLAESLMPDWPSPTSSPPIDLGDNTIQAIWRPLMNESGWGPNRLTSGGLDSAQLIGTGRWQMGQRLSDWVHNEVRIVGRGAFSGAGALRATVTPKISGVLPGGYGGTAVQIRSPGVHLKAGSAIRIDALVRTLGFGAPHHGLLVSDSIGGQAMGVLVRGKSQWTPVRLYRQVVRDADVHVIFELIGAGEAIIDDVQVCVWQPDQGRQPALRPIESPQRLSQIDADGENVATSPSDWGLPNTDIDEPATRIAMPDAGNVIR
ncbi:hypothetical protein [Crateriforma conspicua]|uniref:hypothetical protein n=1 Tax=Crateriforma conspicua TaxID=2527996 RepID=UPI00118D4E9A|nr:hypothetical protein [Crateriforma conspicua]QDV64249.1 hypothetical protein Mal65_34010 [Crateriforma conspicua]